MAETVDSGWSVTSSDGMRIGFMLDETHTNMLLALCEYTIDVSSPYELICEAIETLYGVWSDGEEN